MGLVQAENIQVIGEAYDVALDISFPKGIFVTALRIFVSLVAFVYKHRLEACFSL